ncbi:DoxX family protein [Brevibacterium luteolum]|uniref:DoxX family protein n=1 Tax=Brevibacterium luteolum TaxID=199591 RepID=A0A6G8KV71_9MICO|nr:DoxX family protein [Brevibacterium luteolum]NNG78883.1 DoxX family protein [Brevibacterium luteolum]QIN28689.1 DoxX family protein [Brevibacterium luteolum]
MSLVRLIARPMLASAYIANGVSRIKHPQAATDSITPVINAVKKQVDIPIDAELAARATGVAQVAAGSLLAIGKFPRFSATVLVGTYLIDVIGEQLLTPKEERSQVSLLTKTSMIGGALIASVDTAGKPGLAWRVQHAAEDLRKNVEKTSAKAMDAVNLG